VASRPRVLYIDPDGALSLIEDAGVQVPRGGDGEAG
jgi:hypothetical protein